MDQFLYRLVGSIGTLITSLFLIDFGKHNLLVNILLFTAVLYAAAFLAIDACRAFTQRTRTFDRSSDEGKNEIAKYLVHQLKSSGSVVIFSRDLTWVKAGGEAETLLIKKALDGELTLFVEDELPITNCLKLKGANIRAYKKKGFNPKSRFTILDYRAGKTRIMVGIPSKGKHLIKHYGDEDCEVVDLAKDFISLLECTAKVVK